MRGSRNRWHPRCGFCGLTLTVETGWKEVNVDTFECQKEIYLCRVRMQQRIVDLEAEIKGILDKEDQRLKKCAVNARVEALREVHATSSDLALSDVMERGSATTFTDFIAVNAMKKKILEIIDHLIAREQPALAAPPKEAGEQSGDDS